MLYSKKNRFKPKFKQLLRLRENVQSRKKLLKFQRKKKWEQLIKHYKRKLRKYKKYVPIDQTRYLVTKFSSKGTSYQKRYRDTLHASKKFRIFYGVVSRKFFKNQIKKMSPKHKNFNLQFIQLFESRLDTVLYRAHFAFTIRAAQQLIVHNRIFINNKLVRNKNYILKTGDLISVNINSIFWINKNCWQKLENKPLWPVTQNHLHVNYKTMEIIFGSIALEDLSTNFAFYLQLDKIMLNLKYQ